jgi:RNAse (barnase) inhibitor barstar
MMPLQSVRPNIVQAIRAFRVEDLMGTAQKTGQHFLYANLAHAHTKQEVLEAVTQAFLFPAQFGKNLDTLYSCITDVINKAGLQPGFVLVLEQLPDSPKFDREAREQFLDIFREAADFWAERHVPFRCFYSFTCSQDMDQWERAQVAAYVEPTKPKPSKNSPNLIVKLPPMSSAFDTKKLVAMA